MKKYLLISYGDFQKDSKVAYLLDTISEITSSDILTYKVVDNSIIINFGTHVEFEKLKEYVSLIFERITDFYFLIQQNDNLVISLPESEKDSFTNLTPEMNDVDIDLLTEKVFSDNILFSSLEMLNASLSYNESEDEDEEEDDTLIKKSTKKDYTLDEILDKINEKGISSLTKEETEFLNKLSK